MKGIAMTIELQPMGTPRVVVHAPLSHPSLATASVPSSPAQEQAPRQLDAQSRTNIKEAVDKLNQQMQAGNRNLSFAVDNAADQVVITVKNSSTGEVIRQIPDEALLRVAHNIDDIKGLLHNAST